MYAIELDDGRYLSGFNYGMPDGVYDKFSALKFNSEFEAEQFAQTNGLYTGYKVVSGY
ncbi:hypothetical protein [Weissella cibaria]|uniref:hypothetical protein n=1 Tax=Weissella cibaria TaxID=137591 RepID=UPI0013DBC748|nr:hypothetical protein [Weissella cibaria]